MSQYPANPNPADQPYPTGRYGGPPGTGMYEVAPAGRNSGVNPAGRAALGLAVVTALLQVVAQVVIQSLLGSTEFAVLGAVSGWFSMGVGLCALLAMVFGIVGLRKPGAAKGAAGVGFGVGAYVVVMTLVNIATPLLVHAFH